jgi:PAS domain-containing protein
MAQYPIELILVRQLAGGLAVPTFVVDAAGDLVFVNEAAEALLGLDFEDVGEVSFADWTTAFASRTKGRQRADPAKHPLAVAIRQRQPVHGPLRIVGRDGILRSLVVTALPLEGSRGQLLGGIAMFWEPRAG